MFSGWHCDAENIHIEPADGSEVLAAYGTGRGDTAGMCGDSDNGFGLLFNFNLLGTGEHTVVALADGVEFGRSTFNVLRMSTGEFLSGASGRLLSPISERWTFSNAAVESSATELQHHL